MVWWAPGRRTRRRIVRWSHWWTGSPRTSAAVSPTTTATPRSRKRWRRSRSWWLSSPHRPRRPGSPSSPSRSRSRRVSPRSPSGGFQWWPRHSRRVAARRSRSPRPGSVPPTSGAASPTRPLLLGHGWRSSTKIPLTRTCGTSSTACPVRNWRSTRRASTCSTPVVPRARPSAGWSPVCPSRSLMPPRAAGCATGPSSWLGPAPRTWKFPS